MSAIKNFFKKRKQDLHFSQAGPGRRLCDNTSSGPAPVRSPAATPRAQPTASAQRAGTAALSRFEEQSRPRTARSGRSCAAKAAEEVRQEMASERRELEEAARLAEVYGEKKEKELEASPLLKIDNVRFSCELLGEAELGNFAEMEAKIRDFLLGSLSSEPTQAGALCIHTLEKSAELRQACLATLDKLLENLQRDPNNAKFRRIRLKNKVIEQKIVAVDGAVAFLEGVGFERRQEEAPDAAGEEKQLEPVLVLPADTVLSPEHLIECREALANAEAIRPTLYRDSTVFCVTGMRPAQLSRMELPSEFYRISAEELKKEQELRRQAVEQMGMLRTKAMREREAQRELRRYRYCLIRIRFPDNTVLQGVFFAHDKLEAVMEWLRPCLALDFVPFRLSSPSGQRIEAGEADSSLAELGLAPAAVLSFNFDPDVLQDVLLGKGGKEASAVVEYLRADLLQNARPL